jgi:phosphate transport system protein
MPIYSPRETFDRALQDLLDQTLVLGSMVQQAIRDAMQALQHRDLAIARQIFEADQNINEKRYAIELQCVTLIATQQPMARDVRLLAAVLEIITELERIGDYAKGICKINLLMSEEPIEGAIFFSLQQMANLGLGMLQRALDAFIRRDSKTAAEIPTEDNLVDELYNLLYRKLIDQMLVDTKSIDRASHLMWAAHNLERMADRVTNICERIVYVVTGEMKELDTSNGIEIR